MAVRITNDVTPHRPLQKSPSDAGQGVRSNAPCGVGDAVERRGDGTGHWCRVHKADARNCGRPAFKCRDADAPPVRVEEAVPLDLDEYLGGVALWGAVPAVYDTTRFPMDRGIHVHARRTPGAKKEMDWTYQAVRISGKGVPEGGVVVQEIDAINYMITSVFGYPMAHLVCPRCGRTHLDQDRFGVCPHRRHRCAGCGCRFNHSAPGVGNPIAGTRRACGVVERAPVPSARRLNIRQADYPGGIQIWGSNPAFLWTSPKDEEEGIHVHAFLNGRTKPKLDDTYNEVVIDGIHLDAAMVRVLMAQNAMPSLCGRVRSLDCPSCGEAQFAVGRDAHAPTATHTCRRCKQPLTPANAGQKLVLNPLPAILEQLTAHAPRPPQRRQIDLSPGSLNDRQLAADTLRDRQP